MQSELDTTHSSAFDGRVNPRETSPPWGDLHTHTQVIKRDRPGRRAPQSCWGGRGRAGRMGSLSMRNELLQNSLMLGSPVGWGADHPTLQVSQQRGQDQNPSPGWHLHAGVLPSPFSPEYCGPQLPPSSLHAPFLVPTTPLKADIYRLGAEAGSWESRCGRGGLPGAAGQVSAVARPGSPGPLSPHPASNVPVGLPGGSWDSSRPLFGTLVLGHRACPGQQGLLPPLYLQRPYLHSRSGPWMPADLNSGSTSHAGRHPSMAR